MKPEITDDDIRKVYELAERDKNGDLMTKCEVALGGGALASTARASLRHWVSMLSSRFHVMRQHDGHGFMILEQDSVGSARAKVVDVNLSPARAATRLAELRSTEAN